MIRFSSLQQIGDKTKASLLRFPLPIAVSVAASLCLLWMVELKGKEAIFKDLLQFILTCTLALPAFTGLALFCERYYIKNRTAIVLNGCLLLLLATYFHFLPYEATVITISRHFILFLSAHLFVSFAPFLINLEIQGFWQFNKSLFLRFLTAVLYSAVLFGGLALALVAIENLFEVRIYSEAYIRLFILIGTVFNTWFFLAGVPEEVQQLEQVHDYPNGLRIFTQFVLLPLVSIYLLILYVYELKILVSMNWPRGWVSYLVIGFSTAGILALLLVWPLRNDDKFKWVKIFTRGFFIALFPLILLLFFSIFIRVNEYGITANRYFIIVLAIWLLLNALYFLFSKTKNIKVIPMSLFAAALLSGFGPWNAFEVSRRNQRALLIELLSSQKMFENDHIIAAAVENEISKDVRIEINNRLDYLFDVHGPESVQDLFLINLDSIAEVNGKYQLTSVVLKSLNVEYFGEWGNAAEGSKNFQYSNEMYDQPLFVDGYSSFFKYEYYDNNSNEGKRIEMDSTTFLIIEYVKNSNSFSFSDTTGVKSTLPIQPFIARLFKDYDLTEHIVPDSLMTLYIQGDKFECKIMFRTIYGTLNDAKELDLLTSVQADILYRRRVD